VATRSRPYLPSRVLPKASLSSRDRDSDPVHIYRLHVELLEIAPAIWRRLLVPSWITLAKLHLVLQVAMGWTNSHLHKFEIAGTDYGIPDDEWPELVMADDRRATLAASLGASVTDFRYEYDFGDGWQHSLHVEGIQPLDDHRYPLCIAGGNACPPEDVGGPHGYAEFLLAIGNKRHREHADMLRWCGGAFDPAGFDLNSINAALRRLKIPSRR